MARKKVGGCGTLVGLLLILLVIGYCATDWDSGKTPPAPPKPTAPPTAPGPFTSEVPAKPVVEPRNLVEEYQERFTGKVVAVTDGDTIGVLRDKLLVVIRLHGIDCPERRQAFGTKAKQFTSQAAYGKTVTVTVRDKDRYGWTVAEVKLPDGRNLNREIVKAGFAWWYCHYAPNDRTLERLEKHARTARRGLWAHENPVAPWEFREQQRKARAEKAKAKQEASTREPAR